MVALPPFRGATRRILLVAIAVFFAMLVLGLFSRELVGTLGGLFSLVPDVAVHRLVWQFVTYPFISTSLFGFLFAALSIWFFGAALEEELGPRWLTEFFFVCTIGGGLMAALITETLTRTVEGLEPVHPASTLWPFSMAVLVAFATLHPDQELNFNFILRVKAKYMAALYVLVYVAIMLSARSRFDALMVLTNTLCGWLFLRFAPRRGIRFAAAEGVFGFKNAWTRAKRRRAAKKFKVYMQKQGRDVHFDESGRYVDPDGERKNPNDRKWMN